jgi:hypothetical protein
VNETLHSATVHLELGGTPQWKFALMSQMEQSLSMQKDWGAMGEGDSDEVKRIFLEGNPLLLALTMCVSMLHSGE